jgi:two-component system, chemotaxis family, chemotaxis protein CheY
MNPALKNIRPLVVDDSELMCHLIRGILAAVGIGPVMTAKSGTEALEFLATVKPPPNVLFIDWEMAPMTGIELTQQIRRAQPGSEIDPLIPIIMVTSHTEMSRVLEARDAGIHEYLVKPITGRSVLARLAEVINRPRPFIRTDAYIGPAPRAPASELPGRPRGNEELDLVPIDE